MIVHSSKEQSYKTGPKPTLAWGLLSVGVLASLQFNFQFGFVFVEVVAHVGDGK